MYGVSRTLLLFRRRLHTLRHDGPSETLKRKIADIEKMKKRKNPKKNQLFVEVPESKAFLDTATMPMILTAAGVALFAKLLMMVRSFQIPQFSINCFSFVFCLLLFCL